MSHSCSKLTEMGPLENVIQYPSDSRTTPIFKEPWRFSRTSSCSSGTSSETSRPSLEKSVTLWRIYWSSTASSERLLRHIQGLLEPTCLSTKLLRPSQDAPQTRVTSLKRQFTTRSDTYSFLLIWTDVMWVSQRPLPPHEDNPNDASFQVMRQCEQYLITASWAHLHMRKIRMCRLCLRVISEFLMLCQWCVLVPASVCLSRITWNWF